MLRDNNVEYKSCYVSPRDTYSQENCQRESGTERVP